MLHTPKRLFVGRPLRSDRLGETLLPKRLALPVFCSDPLSSVAYATEQIVLVLGLGGLGLLYLRPWLAVGRRRAAGRSSSRPTGRPATPIPTAAAPTPSAGTTSACAASLVAASALLVDYVLTVAVSVVAGVAAITSAVPGARRRTRWRSRWRFVVLLTVVNLRGVKESGRAFAVPTYGFVAIVLLLLAVAGRAAGAGADPDRGERRLRPRRRPPRPAACSRVFLALRAFASGCTALTGVEAISNGVPELPAAEGAQRRHDPGDHGRAGDHHVRRHHRARRRHARAHGRGPGQLVGLPAGQASRRR